jgi:signal transduction histidine kinase
MDDRLRQTIQDVVNSRAKLDVVYYFHRNPYAWESLGGLAQRLHRAPEDVEGALQDLARLTLLQVRSARSDGELVFSYSRQAPAAAAVGELLEAYEGAERREVLQAICAEDEQTRLRRVAQQRALDDMRTRFISMVTHELRTPVTVIKGVLKNLQASKLITDEQLCSLIDRAGRQSERLSSVVENLLVLSGLQTGGHLELYLSEVDLPRVVAEVGELFNSGEGRPNLQIDLTGAPPAVVADEYLLGQLLEELISNAIKFSPEHAPVTVEVSQDEDFALVIIDDLGAGMSTHQHERVFDPFYQGQQDSSRLTGGMGMGLFMARKIVQSHGGEIWFEPKPPPGMRVCFTVPIAGPKA